MRKIFFLGIMPLLLMNCSVKKNESKISVRDHVDEFVQECPNDGNCTVEYLANKSLKINKDSTNKIYYNLEDNSQKSVVRFEFKKNNPSEMSEANYIEEIVFELQNSDKEIHLADEFLERSKVLFSKQCYCKGQAGIYLVQSGILKISQDKEKIFMQLSFDTSPITHLVTKIEYIIKKNN